MFSYSLTCGKSSVWNIGRNSKKSLSVRRQYTLLFSLITQKEFPLFSTDTLFLSWYEAGISNKKQISCLILLVYMIYQNILQFQQIQQGEFESVAFRLATEMFLGERGIQGADHFCQFFLDRQNLSEFNGHQNFPQNSIDFGLEHAGLQC